jgi:hypothetical protein
MTEACRQCTSPSTMDGLTRMTSAISCSPGSCSLWGEANTDFFKGMVIERQAAKPLAKSA